jgi:DtxR family Mn-dependent transcriptional regulator
MVLPGGIPLTSLEPEQHARIVHLGDEPHSIATRLAAEKLSPGMRVLVIESSPQRVRFQVNGEEHILTPIVAANIEVAPLEEEKVEKVVGESLSTLKTGEKGLVVGISPGCRGPDRRRLMDLGILPGTEIEAELVSPSGDPTAYRVRDAVIALRKEQADLIKVEAIKEAA